MKNLKNNIIGSALSLVLTAAIGDAACAQSISTDSIQKQLDKLLPLKEASNRQILNDRLKVLAASNLESEMTIAGQYYYRLKNTKTSDSVYKAMVVKFPQGKQARSVEESLVFNEKGAANKEAAMYKWMKKFPPEKFKSGEIDDNLAYDYARSAVAIAYAEEKNTKKAIALVNTLETDFWKGNGYNGLATVFYKNGDLANAEINLKKAMDNAESYTDGKKGNSNAAKFAASGYPGITSTYANVLFEEKKYKEALQYSEKAYKSSTVLSPQLNYRYAQILMGLNRNQEAYDKLEEVVKAGKASAEMAEKFKTLYVKVKGSDAGFDVYSAALNKSYLENLGKKLTKDMVKEPAADFTLTDLNGKQVSLKDLKGKIVVLDFWATWCAPCKASFPAMQMAVNKYKNDPNVKFLFIHTWERSETAKQDAQDYINTTKYSFEVLMDLKDAQTKENKVVSSYKVFGIPAKFVIDASGNIRFKLTGFDGSNEAAVDELSMMIAMAKSNS